MGIEMESEMNVTTSYPGRMEIAQQIMVVMLHFTNCHKQFVMYRS